MPSVTSAGRAVLTALGGGAELDPADLGRYERHQPDGHSGPRGNFGDAADQSFMEGADHRSVGVTGVDLERAMAEVDAEASVVAYRRRRSEGKALEEPDHLLGRLLR